MCVCYLGPVPQCCSVCWEGSSGPACCVCSWTRESAAPGRWWTTACASPGRWWGTGTGRTTLTETEREREGEMNLLLIMTTCTCGCLKGFYLPCRRPPAESPPAPAASPGWWRCFQTSASSSGGLTWGHWRERIKNSSDKLMIQHL